MHTTQVSTLTNIYLGIFFFHEHSRFYRTAEKWRGYLFNSSLPLPHASQTFRYYPGDYCRELTSAHSQQPELNREPLVSECKSLNTNHLSLLTVFDFFTSASFIYVYQNIFKQTLKSFLADSEAVTGRCSVKRVFLKISQNS